MAPQLLFLAVKLATQKEIMIAGVVTVLLFKVIQVPCALFSTVERGIELATELRSGLAAMKAQTHDEELVKMWSSRPVTLVHGDLNAGNIWKKKSDESQLCFCDWQNLRMCSVALDFFLPPRAPRACLIL